MWFYIYLIVGCLLTLAFYPWEGKRYELFVAFLVVIFWPVVFYYAFQAAKAQKEELRRQGGEAHKAPSDTRQEDKDQGKGGGA